MKSSPSPISIAQLQDIFYKGLPNLHSVQGIKLLMDFYKKERENTIEEQSKKESIKEEEVIKSVLNDNEIDIPEMTTLNVNGNKYIFSIKHIISHFPKKNGYDIIALVSLLMEHILLDTKNIVNKENKGWSVNYDIELYEKMDLGIVHINDKNRDLVIYKKRRGRDTYSKVLKCTPDTTKICRICVMTREPNEKGGFDYKNKFYKCECEGKVYIINSIFPVSDGYDSPSSEIDSMLLEKPNWLFMNMRTKEEYSAERVKNNLLNAKKGWEKIALCSL